MMFVKHCPDPTLSAVFRFKAPEHWTATEIQEHLDRHFVEVGTTHARHVGIHAQAQVFNGSDTQLDKDGDVKAATSTTRTHCAEGCMEMLASLLDRVLPQNKQEVHGSKSGQTQILASRDRIRPLLCNVCQSTEHTTTEHCRKERLCLACFQPNHMIRNCPNRPPRRGHNTATSQNTAELN